MRIAFVAPLDSAVCDTTARGPSVVIADLARSLRARGHDVAVFCAQGSYLAGIDTAPVLSGAGYDELVWHLEQWGPDVVSVHATGAEGPVRASGLPNVPTLHSNPPSSSAKMISTAASVAVSHDSARRWRAAGLRDVRVVPHGIADIAIGASEPEPVALVAGRIAPEKGTAVALRVARRAGLGTVLVGEICDRAYFAREVVPLLEGVRVLRTLPRERVRALMSRAAVVLAPIASDETFSLVSAEAQMAGCPVAGYARGALPEVVTEGQGVLVTAGDEDALVDAVVAARSLDRDAIRRRAVERFDLRAMIDAHEEILSEAAGAMTRARVAA